MSGALDNTVALARYDAARVELFDRTPRKGWKVWGNNTAVAS
jgi:N6-adenosine-specific RNA methylase IME4